MGRGLALAFAGAGAHVLVNDLRAERSEQVVEEIRAAGGASSSVPFDVTDYGAVAGAVAEHGGVDILVNNAGNAGADGFGDRSRFADSDPADWDMFLRVNLYGVLHCTRAVLPSMIAGRWGRVLTIVSDAARTGDAGGAVYGAAKAGAAGLTRSLAIENGRFNITANNISLGTMRTPLTEPLWAEQADSPRPRRFCRTMRFAGRVCPRTSPISRCCSAVTRARGSPVRRSASTADIRSRSEPFSRRPTPAH